jgi:TonB family protein
MKQGHFQKSSGGLRKKFSSLLTAAMLMLVVALAMPAAAAGERAVKVRSAPSYPELARRMKITGVVVVSATADAAGNVTDAKTVSGNRMLAVAAEDAVRRWKFAPGPDATTETVDINFALGQ